MNGAGELGRAIGQRGRAAAGRGFSLVEMLTVLLILVVVLSILLPALGAARNSARKAATQSLQKTIGDACSQFILDNKRNPGYFSPTDMGSQENADTFGFTQMQNVLLDLSGGITERNRNVSPVPGDGDIITVGPRNAGRVNVSVGEIGNPSLSSRGNAAKLYYRPDPKYFAVQFEPGRMAVGTSSDSNRMPTVVDAWGQPMLAWVADDVPTGTGAFAADVSASGGPRAKFYWASNAGFLRATGTGRSQISQSAESLIGERGGGTTTIGGVSVSTRAASLVGLLANPAGGVISSGPNAGLPQNARGPIVIQSAGANEIFLGCNERGGRAAASASGAGSPTSQANFLPFVANQDPIAGGAFDDVVSSFGN